MKNYNLQNYLRYKKDVLSAQPKPRDWTEYERSEFINKFLPLVENIARKFSTSDQASGVMDITDLIQEGSIGLIYAVDKLDFAQLNASNDIEKTLKSFLSKRIKGSIRRAIDINRGNIKLPEHKLNEIRKDGGQNESMSALFFNSIFLSIDDQVLTENEDTIGISFYEIEDRSEPYNITIMHTFLSSIIDKYLNERESEVLKLSYGLDGDKYSANEIADKLGIEGASSYVRISELKKQAVNKLINSVDHSQVFDFL
jgi:RNA polymerase sigma factor (sigma-70 family)